MKILIVDDENLAISRLKRLLNENGIDDIVAFDNPMEALKEIVKTRFDAVFLDISMPNITGLELADSIMQIEPKTFIVFQTAYEEFALEAFQKGGIGYLVKPIQSEDIKTILDCDQSTLSLLRFLSNLSLYSKISSALLFSIVPK